MTTQSTPGRWQATPGTTTRANDATTMLPHRGIGVEQLCPFCNAVPLAPNRKARRRSRAAPGLVLVHEDGCPLTPEVDRWSGRKREAGRT